MSKSINILLVDDHNIIRSGIKLMLQQRVDFNIIGECDNGLEAFNFVCDNGFPDIILMDINMPVMNGIEATNKISRKFKDAKILALTMHSESEYIINMIKAGVRGYVLKSSGQAELIDAILAVADNRKYYSIEVSMAIIDSLAQERDNYDSSELSEREKEILSLIVKGETNSEVGDKLMISSRTVETHRRNILKKLNLRNTAEMVKYALDNKMIIK